MNENFQPVGKALIVAGAALIIIGLLLQYSGKIPFLSKLPGDIVIRKKNFTFYFPLATSVLLSIIITVILYLIRRK